MCYVVIDLSTSYSHLIQMHWVEVKPPPIRLVYSTQGGNAEYKDSCEERNNLHIEH